MVKKEKISKVNVYGPRDNLVLTSKVFSFPKVMFKAKGLELVSVRSTDVSTLRKGDNITVIFECFNGDRVKCQSMIEKNTGTSIEFKVGDGEVLEERRSSFKVATRAPVYIFRIERGGSCMSFEGDNEIRGTVLDINLGGVLLHTDHEFKVGDIFTMAMLEGQVEISAKILRSQKDQHGVFKGYGCQFTEVTPQNEELLSKFIIDCQMAERERKLALEELQAANA